MLCNSTTPARNDIEELMSLAAALPDLAGDPRNWHEIPNCISRHLAVEPLTMAVIRQERGIGAPTLVFQAGSGAVAIGENAAQFPTVILEIYRATRPVPASDALPLRAAPVFLDASHELIETCVREHPAFGRQIVALKQIDSEHRLMLILHRRLDRVGQTSDNYSIFTSTAGVLARLLRVPLEAELHPELLGAPFNRLTDREWVVLRSLNSDDGEKQLADRLSLSPHTLHSHIKSIYRKVGVQGRLPLLLKYNAALRELRLETLQPARTENRQMTAVV